MGRPGRLLLGTSGFAYRHWRGDFYPPEVPQSRWLEHYAQRFNTLELNVTFYRLPSAEAFDQWARRTPGGFTFVVKGSRTITHYRRLREVGEPLDRLVEHSALLGTKLGCFLWQLPPRIDPDPESLATFITLLAEKTERHGVPRARHAFEFRDARWFADATLEPLRRAGHALVMADPARDDQPHVMASGFAYLRFHRGPRDSGGYQRLELEPYARHVAKKLDAGEDVYALFNNDPGAWAPRNAAEFRGLVAAAGYKGTAQEAEERVLTSSGRR